MKTLILQRLAQDDYWTCGHILDGEGKELCKSMEKPWVNNEHDVSCIPAGVYTAHRRLSPKHKMEVFELDGVPRRGNVQIHIANVPSELLGCIATGLRFGDLAGQQAILQSGDGFRSLMRALVGLDRFTITVRDPAPLAP